MSPLVKPVVQKTSTKSTLILAAVVAAVIGLSLIIFLVINAPSGRPPVRMAPRSLENTIKPNIIPTPKYVSTNNVVTQTYRRPTLTLGPDYVEGMDPGTHNYVHIDDKVYMKSAPEPVNGVFPNTEEAPNPWVLQLAEVYWQRDPVFWLYTVAPTVTTANGATAASVLAMLLLADPSISLDTATTALAARDAGKKGNNEWTVYSHGEVFNNPLGVESTDITTLTTQTANVPVGWLSQFGRGSTNLANHLLDTYPDRGAWDSKKSYKVGDYVYTELPITPASYTPGSAGPPVVAATGTFAYQTVLYWRLNATGYPPIILKGGTAGPQPNVSPGVNTSSTIMSTPTWVSVNAPLESRVLGILADNWIQVSSTMGIKVGDSVVFTYANQNQTGTTNPIVSFEIGNSVQYYVFQVEPGQIKITVMPLEKAAYESSVLPVTVTSPIPQPNPTLSGSYMAGAYVTFGAPLYKIYGYSINGSGQQYPYDGGNANGWMFPTPWPWKFNEPYIGDYYKDGDIVMYHDRKIISKQCYQLRSTPGLDPWWIPIDNELDYWTDAVGYEGTFKINNSLLRNEAIEFVPGDSYLPGDVVLYDYQQYRCIRVTTSLSANFPYYDGPYPEFVLVYRMRLGIRLRPATKITSIDLTDMKPEPWISYTPDSKNPGVGEYTTKGNTKPYLPALFIQNLSVNNINIKLSGILNMNMPGHANLLLWPNSDYVKNPSIVQPRYYSHTFLHFDGKDKLHFPNCGKGAFHDVQGNKYMNSSIAMYCGLQEAEAINAEFLLS